MLFNTGLCHPFADTQRKRHWLAREKVRMAQGKRHLWQSVVKSKHTWQTKYNQNWAVSARLHTSQLLLGVFFHAKHPDENCNDETNKVKDNRPFFPSNRLNNDWCALDVHVTRSQMDVVLHFSCPLKAFRFIAIAQMLTSKVTAAKAALL